MCHNVLRPTKEKWLEFMAKVKKRWKKHLFNITSFSVHRYATPTDNNNVTMKPFKNHSFLHPFYRTFGCSVMSLLIFRTGFQS